MATLAIQTISKAGIVPSLAAAAGGGDEFANNGETFLWVNNGGGSQITVTLVTQATLDGLAVADRAVTVNAGQQKFIGDLEKAVYNDANGRVQVTYSGVTSVTVGAFRAS